MPAEVLAKEPCYLRSERSLAFIRYCERVYGAMLNQYGTADMEQLSLLLDVLQLRPDSRVLDAGCGTGSTTRYLADKSGARFVGIDLAERAVGRALELAVASPDRLSFGTGSMDALDFPASSFDAVVVIDSLYFCKDLAATIGQFQKILRADGQMALFYTHIATSPEDRPEPGGTKLGATLRANGIAFHAHDLSESDRLFWQRAKVVAEELRADFEAEGNGDLNRLGEADAVLDFVRKGRHARYLYHTCKSWGSE
jgi:cyclopropane fatty-acyl-phospholipid synthase-like methyltransferase